MDGLNAKAMTDEQLSKGLNLSRELGQLRQTIERLEDPAFFIELHQNSRYQRSASLISTIGVGENCEHELAELATRFRMEVIMFYESKHSDKLREYEAL